MTPDISDAEVTRPMFLPVGRAYGCGDLDRRRIGLNVPYVLRESPKKRINDDSINPGEASYQPT